MSHSLGDARVLVALPDAQVEDGPIVGEAVCLADELGVEVVTKRGQMAVEYLRELGPTVDCVVCVSACTDSVETLSEVAPSVPLVVFADRAPPTPVDGVVARDGGRGTLAKRVAEQVRRGREHDRLDEANAKLNALNTYTREITACETVQDVVDGVVAAVTDALAYGRCVVALVENGQFVPYGDTLPYEPEITLTVEEGVAGRTYRDGESQLVDEYDADPDRNPRIPDVGSLASIPVDDHGVLQVTSDREGAFDERDVEYLEIVASHASEALSRLRRETHLRVERDRLHAFFDGLPAPTVYVEADVDDVVVVRDVNAAYEAAFRDVPVGDPVAEAFPTATETRLFTEFIRADESVVETVRRDTADTVDCSLTLAFVPVRSTGVEAAGFGVYVADVSLP